MDVPHDVVCVVRFVKAVCTGPSADCDLSFRDLAYLGLFLCFYGMLYALTPTTDGQTLLLVPELPKVKE